MRLIKIETGRSPRRAVLGFLVALSLTGTDAEAFPRGRQEDADVVARSELIVVARLEADSIRKEDIRIEPAAGAAHVHHATLNVTQVLKGRLEEKRIPIVIHYGLGIREHRKDGIEIGDMSMLSFSPLPVKDAREDNLWFLRRRSGFFGDKAGDGDYGIVDPEDLRSIAFKEYFLAYLSDDPEAAVRRVMEEDPEVFERGQRFLDRQEVRRILKIDDPRTRADRLLPYFVQGIGAAHFFEARDGIVACGRVAGPILGPIYRAPKAPFAFSLKEEVIAIWGEIGYRECVPELIALLVEHERFWAEQVLEPDWWNEDVRGNHQGRRRDAWCEDMKAVRTLGQIGDSRARRTIEAVRRRWAARPSGPGDQMLEACEEALKKLE